MRGCVRVFPGLCVWKYGTLFAGAAVRKGIDVPFGFAALFEQLSFGRAVAFQNLHLVDCYLVQFYEPFSLRHSLSMNTALRFSMFERQISSFIVA